MAREWSQARGHWLGHQIYQLTRWCSPRLDSMRPCSFRPRRKILRQNVGTTNPRDTENSLSRVDRGSGVPGRLRSLGELNDSYVTRKIRHGPDSRAAEHAAFSACEPDLTTVIDAWSTLITDEENVLLMRLIRSGRYRTAGRVKWKWRRSCFPAIIVPVLFAVVHRQEES